MANMSYCRFQNTSNDLFDCLCALRDGDGDDEKLTDKYEIAAKKRLLELCRQIADEFGAEEEEE